MSTVAVVVSSVAVFLTAAVWVLMAVMWLPWLPLTRTARAFTAVMLIVVAVSTLIHGVTGDRRGMTVHPAGPAGARLAVLAAVLQLAVGVLFAGFVVSLGMQFRAAARRRDGKAPTAVAGQP